MLRSLDSFCGVKDVYDTDRCCGLDQLSGVEYKFSLEKERSRGGVMSEDPLGVWKSGSSFTSPKVAESSIFCWGWLSDDGMPPWGSRPFMLMLGLMGSSLKSG